MYVQVGTTYIMHIQYVGGSNQRLVEKLSEEYVYSSSLASTKKHPHI